MKDTKTITTIASICMAFYLLYAFFGIGFNGLLFSMAVGLITYYYNESIVLVVASTIIAGIAWKTIIKPRVVDTFEGDDEEYEGFQGEEEEEEETFGNYGGVMSSFAEGFASCNDASPRYSQSIEGFADIDGAAKKEDTTGASKPAEVGKETVSMEMVNSIPNSDAKKDAIQASLPTIGTQEKKVPDESKGGLHIDAAGTLLSALNQLKPDQVEKMTTETRALLETQKSLMGMLQTMKPLLSDGQEMMTTFQNMFGK
jgi:hypothetical protein